MAETVSRSDPQRKPTTRLSSVDTLMTPRREVGRHRHDSSELPIGRTPVPPQISRRSAHLSRSMQGGPLTTDRDAQTGAARLSSEAAARVVRIGKCLMRISRHLFALEKWMGTRGAAEVRPSLSQS
jgi:hypothetical protein